MKRKFYDKLANKLRRRHGIREIRIRIVRPKGYGAAEWICVQIILNNGYRDSINYQKSPDVTIDELLACLMHCGSLTRTIDAYGDQISTIRITVDLNPKIHCDLLDSTNNGEDFMAQFRRRKALPRRLAIDDQKIGKIEEVIGRFGRNSMVNIWVLRDGGGGGNPHQSRENTNESEANSNGRSGNRNPDRGGASDDQSLDRSENQESSGENRGTKRKNQRTDSDEASGKREKAGEEDSKHLLDPQNQDSQNPGSSRENRGEERKNEEQDASAKQGKIGEEDSTNPQPVEQKPLPPISKEEFDKFFANLKRSAQYPGPVTRETLNPPAQFTDSQTFDIVGWLGELNRDQQDVYAALLFGQQVRPTEAANPPVQDLPPEQHGTDLSSQLSHVGAGEGLRMLAALAGHYSDILSEDSPDNAILFSEDVLGELAIQAILHADIEKQAKPTNPAEAQNVNPEPVVQEGPRIEDIDSFQDLLVNRNRDDPQPMLNPEPVEQVGEEGIPRWDPNAQVPIRESLFRHPTGEGVAPGPQPGGQLEFGVEHSKAANPPVQDLPPEQHGTDLSSQSRHVGSDEARRRLPVIRAPLSAPGPYSDISPDTSPDSLSEEILDETSVAVQKAILAECKKQAEIKKAAEAQKVNPEPVIRDIDDFQELFENRDRDIVLEELNESEDRHFVFIDPDELQVRRFRNEIKSIEAEKALSQVLVEAENAEAERRRAVIQSMPPNNSVNEAHNQQQDQRDPNHRQPVLNSTVPSVRLSGYWMTIWMLGSLYKSASASQEFSVSSDTASIHALIVFLFLISGCFCLIVGTFLRFAKFVCKFLWLLMTEEDFTTEWMRLLMGLFLTFEFFMFENIWISWERFKLLGEYVPIKEYTTSIAISILKEVVLMVEVWYNDRLREQEEQKKHSGTEGQGNSSTMEPKSDSSGRVKILSNQELIDYDDESNFGSSSLVEHPHPPNDDDSKPTNQDTSFSSKTPK